MTANFIFLISFIFFFILNLVLSESVTKAAFNDVLKTCPQTAPSLKCRDLKMGQ